MAHCFVLSSNEQSTQLIKELPGATFSLVNNFVTRNLALFINILPFFGFYTLVARKIIESGGFHDSVLKGLHSCLHKKQ